MRRWFLAVFVLAAAALAGAYVFSTQIFSATIIWLGARQGILIDDIALRRPGLRGMEVDRLVASVEHFTISASDVEIAYDLSAIPSTQTITAVVVDDLRVRAKRRNGANEDGAGAQAGDDVANIVSPELFDALPDMEIRKLTVEVAEPVFVGAGRFSLNSERARFELAGIEPEFAREIRVDAELRSDRSVEFSFFELGEAHKPFLEVHANTTEGKVDARGRFDLSGYPLGLLSGVLNLPAGTGRLRGNLFTSVESVSAVATYQNLELTGDYLIDWRDERVHLDAVAGQINGSMANMTTTLSGGAVSLPATGIRFSIDAGTTVHYAGDQISIGPGMKAAVHGLDQVDLQSAFDRTDIDLRTDALKVKTGAAVRLSADGLETGGSVGANVSLAGDRLQADLDIGVGDLNLVLHASYNLESGHGSFAGSSRVEARNLFKTLVFNWPYQFDIVSGDVGIDLQGAVNNGEVECTVAVELIGSTIRYGEYDLADTTAQLDFGLRGADVQLRPSSVTVGEVDVGLLIEDAKATLAWQGDQVDIQAATFNVLGGGVTLAPAKYDLASGRGHVDLAVADVDLAEVLALEGDDIVGTGRLFGNLPIDIDNGAVSMAQGQIRASEAGGTIALTPEFAVATGQPGIDFALRALANFRYTALTAVANLVQNGDLQLAVSLQGSNPAVEKGRPIHYNLNISENVFALMQALGAQSGITSDIERRVLEGQMPKSSNDQEQ